MTHKYELPDELFEESLHVESLYNELLEEPPDTSHTICAKSKGKSKMVSIAYILGVNSNNVAASIRIPQSSLLDLAIPS